MKLSGYFRPDGKMGIRNHVLILPSSLCASETARYVSMNVPGSLYLPNQGGCSLGRRDYQVTLDTLTGIALNPNVFATVIIGNGCEVMQADCLADHIRNKTTKPLEAFIIRDEGGSIKTIEKAVNTAKSLVREAGKIQREEISISDIILGTECGGSDPTSGLASNLVIGRCSDRLIELGGTSILSETPEMLGAEHILARRCHDEVTRSKLLNMIKDCERDFKIVGEDPRNGNPTPGNIAGGITTLEEKSLGCIHKGGNGMIQEVLEYAKWPSKKGLIIMDTPGQDIASIAGMAAAGTQVVLFSTGHGTPTGFGILPVIKITGNRSTAISMADHIDFDCSDIIMNGSNLNATSDQLFHLIEEVINGKETKAEILGFNDMSMARYCNFA